MPIVINDVKCDGSAKQIVGVWVKEHMNGLTPTGDKYLQFFDCFHNEPIIQSELSYDEMRKSPTLFQQMKDF